MWRRGHYLQLSSVLERDFYHRFGSHPNLFSDKSIGIGTLELGHLLFYNLFVVHPEWFTIGGVSGLFAGPPDCFLRVKSD